MPCADLMSRGSGSTVAPGSPHERTRILVTGGSGFIGSALVKALVKDGHAVRVLDDNSRGAPRRLAEVQNDVEFIAGDIRDAAAVACRGARRRRGPPSRLRQRHRILLQRAGAGARRRRQGHGQRDRRLPRRGRAPPRAGVELGGLSDAAAGADRRERAARRARSDQPALFLWRRQDHQRADGDQLRPQIFRARADLSPAQCLRPGHGLRARHSAVRAAPQACRGAAQERQGAVRDPGRRAADPQLLSRRRSRARRDGDARQGRASRHLSRRHDRRGHDRRRRAGGSPPMPAARSNSSAGRLPPAAPSGAAPTSASSPSWAMRPQVSLAKGLPPTVDWYWANESLAPKA